MNSLSIVKKEGRRPSKHTQQITESSVIPNYNPTDAVKKISEEDWRKEKKPRDQSLYLQTVQTI